MGTTVNKALRYPEGTVAANTLHTQIKNLADDVDAALVEAPIISRSSGFLYPGIATISTGASELPYYMSAGPTVPAGARTVRVSMSWTASSTGNAQVFWSPAIRFVGGGADILLGSGLGCHNHAVNQTNLGMTISASFNSLVHVGREVELYVNGSRDMGGTAISCGNLIWTIEFSKT